MKISFLNSYLDGKIETYDKKEALKKCGKIASICYSKNGLETARNEKPEKISRTGRINDGKHKRHSLRLRNMAGSRSRKESRKILIRVRRRLQGAKQHEKRRTLGRLVRHKL